MTGGKQFFCAFVLALSTLLLHAEKTDTSGKNLNFAEMTRWGRGINNQFRALSPGCFEMQVERGTQRAVQTACASGNITVVGQDRLIFTVIGAPENKSSRLTVLVVFRNGKTLKTKSYSGVSIRSARPKNYSLGMTEIFDAPDLPSKVAQIKFQLDSGSEAMGHVSRVRITGVSVVAAGEAGKMTGRDDMVVLPSPRPKEPARAVLPSLKLFFDFDNDDKNLVMNTRWSTFKAVEKKYGPGFRDRLLRGTCGLLAEASSPESADVIVYVRTTPSPHASAIAGAVKNGRGLLLYGDVHDPVLAELLPVKITPLPFQQLPPRAELKITSHGKDLYSGSGIRDGTYAVFRTLEVKDGGQVLSELNGPAVVSSADGKIIYSTVGIGVSQIRSRALYDLFFLRAAALTGGKKELAGCFDLLEARQLLLYELKSRSDVCEVLGKKELSRKNKELYDKLNSCSPDMSLKTAVADIRNELLHRPAEELLADGVMYRSGAHNRNFGRFGWDISEGLPGAVLRPSLAISGNTQEYVVDFESLEQNTLKITCWDRAPLSGAPRSSDRLQPLIAKNGTSQYRWEGKGTMRFTSEIEIPESWRGKDVSFLVEGGIDDTDVTFFNGRMIGKVDASVPGYWHVPRRYRIPAESIRFGKKNLIRCDITNLQGDAAFNSVPLLTIPKVKNRTRNVTVSSLDWIHKRYDITDNSRRKLSMTVSLAIPYILYETPELNLTVNTENLATHAAFMTEKGLKTVPLKEASVIYDRKRDGRLKESWFMFWNTNASRPFVICFARSPEAVQGQFNNGALTSLLIRGNRGALIAGWPFGASNIDSGKWNGNLPGAVLERLRGQQKFIFNFPVGCKEIYALSKDRKTVHIRERFRLRHLENEFGIAPTEYAVLPPLVGFALQKNMLASSDGVTDFHISTEAGPLIGKEGTSAIHYTLAAPPRAGFYPIGIKGAPQEKKLVADIFHKAARWSCGGYVPENAWTPQAPQGKNFLSKNFCFCGWSFCHIYCFQAFQFMESPERERFLQRAGWRFFEPLERYAFKLAFRYREEPFTYINYPVMLPPFYKNRVPFADGYGSSVIFGDENEPGYILPAIARYAADVAGQYGSAIVNWNMLRDTMAFALASEDWACMTSGCRESWEGAFIDMLNCEYPMMREYETLARMNGDTELAEEAVYRAARKMVPTLMRFHFQDYMQKANLNNGEKNVRFITGWREKGGASFLLKDSGNLSPIDVFDVAGGISEHTLILYKMYVNDMIRERLKRDILPAAKQRTSLLYIAPLSVFAMPREELDFILSHFLAKVPAWFVNDQSGMKIFYLSGMVLYRRHPEFFIDSVHDLTLNSAVCDPESGTASFRFLPGKKGVLKLYSAFLPESVRLNGRELPVRQVLRNGLLCFSGGTGEQSLEIRMGKERNPYRHPMIKNLVD